MANTKTARKAIRQIARRTNVNKARRSRMRTYIRAVETAIAAGDKTAAQDALRQAEAQIMRAARRNVLHKRAASRSVSRLSARVKTMNA